jgi:hypothetical protein
MHASRLALIAAVLAIPSAVYSQDSGLVDGRVGSDLSTASTQPSPSNGLQGAYRRPPEPGPRAGSSGVVMPGQVVPGDLPCLYKIGREQHGLCRRTPRNSWPELESHLAGR